MVEVLTDLRDNYGAVDVKAEFESEGARLNELMRLKEIASRCGMGIVLKIGGPEAIRDIFDAMTLGVSGIVAPMVESAYALQKFLEAIAKHVPEDAKSDIAFAVNVETIQAYQNLDRMLALPGAHQLSRITVGRVDLCGSLDLGRQEINSEKIFEITKGICEKTRAAKLSPTIGGAITPEAIPFIRQLVDANLLDRFETRKIIFSASKGLEDAAESLRRANRFELQWLCNKHDYYHVISVEDKERIRMLEKRTML